MRPYVRPEVQVRADRRGCRGVARAPRRARSCSRPPTRCKRAHAGDAVVLVRPFTEADDVAGFHAAQGILTSKGGKASHAALVARGMGRPCVAGASELQIDLDKGSCARTGAPCGAAT